MHDKPAIATFWLMLLAAPVHAEVPADLELVEFASGLSNPLAVRHAGDGSGRLYVVERGGTVIAFDAAGTALGTVLSFTTNSPPLGFSVGSGGDERGLLGLAFHPDFPTDARMFVYYTDGNSDTVVASYEVNGDPPVAVPGSAAVVLRVDQDFQNHNGGDIHFGPEDGMLYIALGDGGGSNDDCNRAQTLDPQDLQLSSICAADPAFNGDNPDSLALLGKLLRIDVDGVTAAGGNGLCGGNGDGSASYAIPAENPFAGGGTANGCDEVWHYGLRNPYRFSFDRDGGDLFIGDVGQGAWEEIDHATAGTGGLDFGWRACEGSHERGTVTPCTDGSTLPILEFANSGTTNCAVTGGYRYRGPITPLVGEYIYGDYCSGRVFIATEGKAGWSPIEWRDTSYNISSFGEGEDGALYLTNFFGGQVFRFESAEMHRIFGDGFE